MKKLLYTLIIPALLVAGQAAFAHAFPDNSSPHVGATVAKVPPIVKVWFDGEIAPIFSTLIVKNTSGQQVSKGKGAVSSSNNTLLLTRLPATLPPGKYWVYWSVIAHDGHHTEGHFPFTIK